MNFKETLKDAFEKLYKQSVQHFEKRSKELFFNKSKLVLAKEKICSPCKSNVPRSSQGIADKGSMRNVDPISLPLWGQVKVNLLKFYTRTFFSSSQADQPQHNTWITTIYKRKKPPARKQVKTLKQQKENLRDFIDRLYLCHLVEKKNIMKSQNNTKTTKEIPCLLTRNLRNTKERKGLSQSQEIGETKNRFRTLSDSKITVRPKQKIAYQTLQQQRESENSTQEDSNVKSINDSGVFVEEDTSISTTTDDEALKRTLNKTLRKRSLTQDDRESSHFKRLKLFERTEDLKNYQKNLAGSRRNKAAKFGHTMHTQETKSAFVYRKSSAQGKSDFQPLFSSHCGGTWKAIVDEN